jgi:hypothetical protein
MVYQLKREELYKVYIQPVTKVKGRQGITSVLSTKHADMEENGQYKSIKKGGPIFEMFSPCRNTSFTNLSKTS